MIAEMKKTQQRKLTDFWRYAGFFGLGVMLGGLLLFTAARLAWHSKFYPGVEIAGVAVGGLSRSQAEIKLEQAVADYQPGLTYADKEWVLQKGKIEFGVEEALSEAYRYGRRLQITDYLKLLINKKINYPLGVKSGFEREFEEAVGEIGSGIEIPAVEASLEVKNKRVELSNGSDGVILDRDSLWVQVASKAQYLDKTPTEIPTKKILKTLSQSESEALLARGERLINSKLVIEFEDAKIELGAKELLPFLATSPGLEVLNEAVIGEYTSRLAESFNRSAQNAKFVFEDGRVKEFAPGKDGVEVKVEETKRELTAAVEKLLNDQEVVLVKVAVTLTPPAVSTDKVNDLGIKERIGRGESYYAHSIANRIYNIGLSSSRINSTLVAPGEEFSFNQSVGEVSGDTGYKTAYVISGGRTVLGDGGGVCQVSTTIFRAAMNAGLPITERWAHAYRVGYYEQNSKAGVDATVYAPSKDFRFKNDTPGHILVQLINEPKKLHLVVEIYGTNDGRLASVTEPKVWGVSPPPPDIYQDDATIPAGEVRQVDWAAWGAKASFEYKVTKNGEVIQERVFTSAYRPWANVYLRGTGPTSAQ